MSDAITSARQAALKMLLEEVQPLFDQMEQISATMGSAKVAMQSDIETFGKLVADHKQTLEAACDLFAAVQGLERSGLSSLPMPAKPAAGGLSTRKAIALAIGSALLASVLTGGTLALVGSDLLDDAKVGRAVTAVWPQLDEATKARIQRGGATR